MKLIIILIFYAFIILMLLEDVTIVLQSKNISNSFVIGRSFEIPFLIRPWERDPARKKRSVFSVASCDFPFGGWMLVTDCLPSASFFSFHNLATHSNQKLSAALFSTDV